VNTSEDRPLLNNLKEKETAWEELPTSLGSQGHVKEDRKVRKGVTKTIGYASAFEWRVWSALGGGGQMESQAGGGTRQSTILAKIAARESQSKEKGGEKKWVETATGGRLQRRHREDRLWG